MAKNDAMDHAYSVVDGTPVSGNLPRHCLIYQHKLNLCIFSGRVMSDISNNWLFYFLKAPDLCHAVFYMNGIYVLGQHFYYSCWRNANF